MVYRVYNQKKSIPAVTVYTCSKCGKTVMQKQTLYVESSYSDKGAWTQASVDRRKDAATESLLRSAEKLTDDLQSITADSNFSKLKLNGRCNGCGNREPWDLIHRSPLVRVTRLLRWIGFFDLLFILLFLVEGLPIDEIPLAMSLVLGLWLAAELALLIYKAVLTNKIHQLPPASIPKAITAQKKQPTQ